MGQIVFVTGTDTGAGKTLLTALLLVHLRPKLHALAMKPFCSGGRRDLRILSAAQDHELPPEALNPFYFEQPLAPFIAARNAGVNVNLADVLKKIRSVARRCQLLLVEGAGGLLVPLGKGYGIAEVIRALRCPVLLVVQNKLGAINHALLTLRELHRLRTPRVTIVVMDPPRPTLATRTNPELLAELASGTAFVRIPFLGRRLRTAASIRSAAKKIEKPLADLLEIATFSRALRGALKRE